MHQSSGPMYVSWNYTYRCNFSCSHCYSRSPSYPPELSTEQYRKVVKQLLEINAFTVALGGGEVVMRKDCFEMLTKMGAGGINTHLTTNGWYLDDAMASELKHVGLGTLYVSLDSSERTAHDDFRRKEGSFDRVGKALETAVRHGLAVRLSTVVTSINRADLGNIVAVAENLGLKGVEFKRFRAAGNGLSRKSLYELSADQNERLREDISKLQHSSSIQVVLVYGVEGGDDGSSCPCGSRSICIRPNGDVSPCAYGEQVVGNLMERSLADLWTHSPELKAIRSAGACQALRDNPLPSNPYRNSTESRSLG